MIAESGPLRKSAFQGRVQSARQKCSQIDVRVSCPKPFANLPAVNLDVEAYKNAPAAKIRAAWETSMETLRPLLARIAATDHLPLRCGCATMMVRCRAAPDCLSQRKPGAGSTHPGRRRWCDDCGGTGVATAARRPAAQRRGVGYVFR